VPPAVPQIPLEETTECTLSNAPHPSEKKP